MKDEIKDNVLTGKDDSKGVTKKEVDEEEDGEAGSGKADGELEGDTGEDEDGEGLIKLKPPRPPRKKVKETRDSPLYEEDIVEGFSFAAFETYDDLEVGHSFLITSYMTEKKNERSTIQLFYIEIRLRYYCTNFVKNMINSVISTSIKRTRYYKIEI